MVSCLVSWVLAAAVGQAPAAPAQVEAGWLNIVPADIDAVVRVKSIEAARGDAAGMVAAMMPTNGQELNASISESVQDFVTRYGQAASRSPYLMLFRFGELDVNGELPFAAIVQNNDYANLQRKIAGRPGVKPKAYPAGYQAIENLDGQMIYFVAGRGFVAFGTDEKLIAAITRPKAPTLARTLPAAARTRLLAQDIGIYLNVATLQERFGQDIDQARQGLIESIAEANAQGGAAATEGAKIVLGGLFSALKQGQTLAMSVELDPREMTAVGEVSAKPGTAVSRRLANAQPADAADLAKLPSTAVACVFRSVRAATFEDLHGPAQKVLVFGEEEKPAPAVQKAIDQLGKLGPQQVFVAVRPAPGVQDIRIFNGDDPQAVVKAEAGIFEALRGGSGFIKAVTLDPKTTTHEGFALRQATMQPDFVKLAAGEANPGDIAALKKAFGGETLTTWFGTDGRRVLEVTAHDWNAARPVVDAVLTGRGSIGQVPDYAALRKRLPGQVSTLIMVNAQSTARQISENLAAALPEAKSAKAPVEIPKGTSLLAASVTSTTAGTRFQAIIPSAVGPIFEKALSPAVEEVQGKTARK